MKLLADAHERARLSQSSSPRGTEVDQLFGAPAFGNWMGMLFRLDPRAPARRQEASSKREFLATRFRGEREQRCDWVGARASSIDGIRAAR